MNGDELCIRLLADTHHKLHAFTLAEYYYAKSKTINLSYLQSLVHQNNATKCEEALAALPTIENEALTDDERTELTVVLIKYAKTNSSSNNTLI